MENFFKTINCAVVVWDKEGKVLYQNDKSISKDGNVCGNNLIGCHKPESWKMIQKMLNEDCSNIYQVIRTTGSKLVFQTPWYEEDGSIGGLVEIVTELPENLREVQRGLI